MIAAAAGAMIYRLNWSVLRTLEVCAVLGLAAGLVGLLVTDPTAHTRIHSGRDT